MYVGRTKTCFINIDAGISADTLIPFARRVAQ